MTVVAKYPPIVSAAVGLAVLYAIYQIYTRINLHLKRRSLKASKGTQEAAWHPRSDHWIGIGTFLDNIKALKAHRFLEYTTERFADSGANTFQFIQLGRRIHFTVEPENLKIIQAVDFKKWGLGKNRKKGFLPLLGKGIFSTDGAEWQHSREMLRPNFARTQIADLRTFERHTQHLISMIPRDGSVVDLSELFFRLTMDSATEFLFGESTESLTKGSTVGFADAFGRGQEHIAHLSRWGKWSFLASTDKNWPNDQKFVHDFVDYYVQKGLARRSELLSEKENPDKTGRYVFLEELVRQTTDPIQIRSELLNILLAGRDTTASLLTNVWFILSRTPDIWVKLQAEIAKLDGSEPTFEQLKDMKFLRGLMNESLRLHPVVPANSREAKEDTTLPLGGGPDGLSPIFVKKGELVSWSPYTMHRRKDYYGEDAEEFVVERWLDNPETGKKGLRPGWEYLPFNGGARICLGQQFALTEASYTTVRMCQAFDRIESRDSEPWTEGLTLTCVSLNGAKVSLGRRGT